MGPRPSSTGPRWRWVVAVLGGSASVLLVLASAFSLHLQWQLLTPLWAGPRLVPVPAQLEQVYLQPLPGGKRGQRAKIVLAYRYPYGGHSHLSRRLTFDPQGFEHYGESLRELHDRLAGDLAARRPVTAWVDPGAPAFAVLDKRVRWSFVAIVLPFLLGCPYLAWRIASAAVRSALGRPGPERLPIVRRRGVQPWPALLLSGAVALAFAVVGWRSWPGSGFSLFATAAATVTLAMGWRTWRRLTGRSGIASASLALTPPQPLIGRPFTVHLRWRGVPRNGSYLIRLSCVFSGDASSGGRPSMLWHEERLVSGLPSAVAGEISALTQWQLPDGLPPSHGDTGESPTRWLLSAQDLVTHDKAEFELAVEPSRFDGQPPPPAAVDTSGPASTIPPALFRVAALPDGCVVRSAPVGWRGGPGALAALALAMGGFVGYVLAASPSHATTASVSVAAVAGVLLAMLAAGLASHRAEVTIDAGGLWLSQRSLLWARRRHVPLEGVHGLRTAQPPMPDLPAGEVPPWELIALLAAGESQSLNLPLIDARGIAAAVEQALTAGLQRARAAAGARLRPSPRRGLAGQWSQPAAAWCVAIVVAGTLASSILHWHDERRRTVTVKTEDGKRVTGQLIEDPVKIAIVDGRTQVLESLLAGGRDVNQRDADGLTALHFAALAGRVAEAAVLLRHDADVNAQVPITATGGGETPLMYAAQHVELSRLLLDAGADASRVDKYGRGATHWAARMNSPRTLALLRERGHDIDAPARGPGGETPLMMAVWFSSAQSIEWLAQAGADPSRRDARGRGLRHYARGASNEALSMRWVDRLQPE